MAGKIAFELQDNPPKFAVSKDETFWYAGQAYWRVEDGRCSPDFVELSNDISFRISKNWQRIHYYLEANGFTTVSEVFRSNKPLKLKCITLYLNSDYPKDDIIHF